MMHFGDGRPFAFRQNKRRDDLFAFFILFFHSPCAANHPNLERGSRLLSKQAPQRLLPLYIFSPRGRQNGKIVRAQVYPPFVPDNHARAFNCRFDHIIAYLAYLAYLQSSGLTGPWRGEPR